MFKMNFELSLVKHVLVLSLKLVYILKACVCCGFQL